MYYIRIDSENANKLVYYCRHCGNEDKMLTVDNICVSKVQMKKSEQSFHHIINKYTKLDPTLPRINTILCPNPECQTNGKGENESKREIIYIRYDDTNMKYVYLCSTCDTVWKTNEEV
jgi:DNA-directed RNA polymerase subunit M/transcription elongation factor TFIIS